MKNYEADLKKAGQTSIASSGIRLKNKLIYNEEWLFLLWLIIFPLSTQFFCHLLGLAGFKGHHTLQIIFPAKKTEVFKVFTTTTTAVAFTSRSLGVYYGATNQYGF